MCKGWHAAVVEAKQSYRDYAAREDVTHSVAGDRRQETKVENNLYRDSSLADPGKPVYLATGPWTAASLLSAREANALIDRSLPKGIPVTQIDDADLLNKKILSSNPNFSPPYIPGTNAVVFTTTQKIKFVRVYNPDTNSGRVGEWIMSGKDIENLSPQQIGSKFAWPQVPAHMSDVYISPGQKLGATISNDINIFADKSFGGNGGGGGVRFEILGTSSLRGEWFFNERKIK